jgi:hypothetical protein
MLKIRRRHAVWLGAAVLLILQWSLPANASVTCAVRRHGQYVCTFFCQNGFICDNDNLRCLPGPAIQAKLSDLEEKARVAALNAHRVQVKSAQQANSQSTGYDLGSTYYVWDGDPREIPTPRYRQGGGFTSIPGGGIGTARQTVRASLQSRMAAAPRRSSISLPSIGTDALSASAPSPSRPSTTAKEQPKYWDGTDYSDYCANANSFERGAALYGYLCTPDSPSCASQARDTYQPFPDPKDLDRKVSQICGPYSRDTRQCFFENKLRIVLDNNPDIRDACAGQLDASNSLRNRLATTLRGGDDDDQGDLNANAYTRCVDDAYLHGLHPKSGVSLREQLKQRLEKQCEETDKTAGKENDEPRRPPPDKLPDDDCGPGRGLKPDPTAFGAWTCQPLGGGLGGQDNDVANDAGSAAAQNQAIAVDPTSEELENYLNMLNPNSGGSLRGDLGTRSFPWGSDDYQAIEKLQQ